MQSKSDGTLAFLKILSRQGDTERRARFFREASAYATVDHDGIPRLVESNAHHHQDLAYKVYLITEFIEGPTLTKYVDDNGAGSFGEDGLGFDRARRRGTALPCERMAPSRHKA